MIAMKLTAHCTVDCCNTVSDDEENALCTISHMASVIVEEQPQTHTTPQNDATQTGMKEASTQTTIPVRADCGLLNPSPNIRANRLIIAMFLDTVVLTASSIRMHDITNPCHSPDRWYSTPKSRSGGLLYGSTSYPSSLRRSVCCARLATAGW